MTYLKLTNGTPEIYTIGQLRRDNPNVSFPKNIPTNILEQYGIYAYSTQDQPAHNEKTQKLREGNFVQDEDGVWSKSWVIVEKTQEEIDSWINAKVAEVRDQRNRLLAETDYLALSDNTLTAEMAAYRQALRDITLQVGFPENIVWPTKP